MWATCGLSPIGKRRLGVELFELKGGTRSEHIYFCSRCFVLVGSLLLSKGEYEFNIIFLLIDLLAVDFQLALGSS